MAAEPEAEPRDAEPQDDVPEPVEPGLLPRVPYSVIRHEFIYLWGYRNGTFEPEHVEILGPSGSGKTYAEATIIQERVRLRDSAVVFIATKPVDSTIMKLGFPIVTEPKQVKKHKQVIFWPRTRKLGTERNAYIAAKIKELLALIWRARAPVILVFDEIAALETFDPDLKAMIQMFWREARSVGITIIAMKQRPQGVSRDMHSETSWVLAFRPKDQDDAMRVAELMGSRRYWMPILASLDRGLHEFVLLDVITGDAVICWIDVPLRPAEPTRRGIYKGGR